MPPPPPPPPPLPSPTSTHGTARGSWPRFIAAFGALVVVVVGIPAVLVTVTRLTLDAAHPLPGIGTTDEIGRWLDRELSSAEIAPALLRVLLSVCWLLWIALVSSVLASIAASRPQLERIRLPHIAMFDGIGAWIAAGLTALSSLAPNLAHSSHAAVPAATSTATIADTSAATSQPTIRPVPHRDGWVIVESGESVEMLAARALGDASRWPDIWALNQGRAMNDGTSWTQAWRLVPGWELELPPRPSAQRRTAEPASPSTISDPAAERADDPASDPPATAPADPAATTVVVDSGDTAWDITHAGYGTVNMALVDFVADHNDLADPDVIHPGQELTLPPLHFPPAPAPAPAPAAASEPATWPTHTVVDGDTVWAILEARHGHVDADMVWAYATWAGLEDPSAIDVGQQLHLPPLDVIARPAAAILDPVPAEAPIASAPSTTPEPPTTVEPPLLEPAPTATPSTSPPPVTTVPGRRSPAESDPTAVPVGAAPTPAAPTPAATTTTSAPAAPAPAPAAPAVSVDDADAWFDPVTRSVWWSVPMGVLLAGGVAGLLRRLRRRRLGALAVGEQLAAPAAVTAGTELAVTVTGAEQRVTTLRALLGALTPHARELADPPPVRAVEVDADQVEVLFATPAPFPPTGWSSVDGGRSWVHRLADTTATSSQLVTPSLVTVGMRPGGGEILVDIETAGSLSVTGDARAARQLVRSMVLELASYPLGVPVDVGLVGFDLDGADLCDRVWSGQSITRAVRAARELLTERSGMSGDTSMVAARAALDFDEGGLDPHVFVVDVDTIDEHEPVEELIDLCQPQAGAAVILLGGDRLDARERVVVDAHGRAVWSGIELRAPQVSREAGVQLGLALDDVVNTPSVPAELSAIVAELDADAATDPDDRMLDDASSNGDHEVAAAVDGEGDNELVYVEPDREVTVAVMGEVAVTGRDITNANDVELLALLTVFRDRRPNADTLADMLLPDHDIDAGPADRAGLDKRLALRRRSITTRISSLRRKLGDDATGAALLPRSLDGRGATGRYGVTAKVLTDIELLEHRYRSAVSLPSGDALTVLRDGLELLRGPLFQARKGYSWAYSDGHTARAISIITMYAKQLMDLAFDAGDLGLVLETVRRAGIVIDDPVVEVPLRRLEADYADASGDTELLASARKARRRLLEFAAETDALASDDA